MTMASELIGVVIEQLEGLLLALQADRPGGRRRRQEHDLEGHQHQQGREDALADGGAGERRRAAEAGLVAALR